jgi:hypothetical protein
VPGVSAVFNVRLDAFFAQWRMALATSFGPMRAGSLG